MRRIASLAAAALMLLGGGCRTIHTPWARTAVENPDRPLDAPEVRTARDAVPDSVMLRGQIGPYSDSPSGP